MKTTQSNHQKWLTIMLRLGKHIRLTRPEIERFTKITNFEPVNVCTLADLDAYIAKCKRHYRNYSPEMQFLHWMIDQERLRCCGEYRPHHKFGGIDDFDGFGGFGGFEGVDETRD